jgi:hypothetical protein
MGNLLLTGTSHLLPANITQMTTPRVSASIPYDLIHWHTTSLSSGNKPQHSKILQQSVQYSVQPPVTTAQHEHLHHNQQHTTLDPQEN